MSVLDLLMRDAAEALNCGVTYSPLNNKKVLVTGATGLIGGHIMAILFALKREGMNIAAAGLYNNTPAKYTYELFERANFKLYDCSDLFVAPEADVIIHCAGYGQPVIFLEDPAGTIHVNTTITEQLLQLVAPGGTFLFVSSNEVYHGLQKEFAVEEDIGTTTPYNPRAGYIEGKRAGEAITYAYRKHGVNALSARLNLTYGPGARAGDKRALSGFIDQAIKTGRIELKFAGKEMRTCCYARDVATMLLNVALHGSKPVYNVGERATTSIAEIAGIVAKLTGAKLTVPQDDAELPGSHSLPRMDISLMESDLGETSYMPLEEGLRRTIEWHKELAR